MNNKMDIETPQDGANSPNLKRATYYLEPEMIKALGIKAVLEGRDKSDIVRSALDAYIEKKYWDVKV